MQLYAGNKKLQVKIGDKTYKIRASKEILPTNKYAISGDITFNDDGEIAAKDNFQQNLEFKCNGVTHSSIAYSNGTLQYDDTEVYSNDKWKSQSYKKITIVDTQYVTEPVHSFLTKGGCFVAGTPVLMADGSTKAIENIVVDDLLLTYNESNKAYGVGKVLRVTEKYNNAIARITFEDGNCIELTLRHPLYIDGVWKTPAGSCGKPKVEVGDKVLSTNGSATKIVAIEFVSLDTPIAVYNFEVEGDHNYFAGKSNILAHNYGSK